MLRKGYMKLKGLKKKEKNGLQKVNAEKAMFDDEKAQSEFRKENVYGEKNNQETPRGKVVSKESSDEYIETKTKALKAIDNKFNVFLLLENSIKLELRK